MDKMTEAAKEFNDDESSSSDGCSTVSENSDENKERGNWTRKMDFWLSLVGYAVGLGNIWRFPYLCYKSGGGAFLIPYTIFLFLCGVPLFFLEVSFGQFASLSPITIWRICPLFKGTGIGMAIVSGMCCLYYNVLIAWTLYFLFMSMRTVLPWSTCGNDWNTEHCFVKDKDSSTSFKHNQTVTNFTNSKYSLLQQSSVLINSSSLMNSSSILKPNYTSPSEEFWEKHVLQITDGIDNMGELRWQLFLCLLGSWILVFLCLCKGVKSSGKVVYITATFPYLVLLILLVRGVTLPGAVDGLKWYLIPKWEKLATFQVWGDAAVQIFYSVGMAWGGLITLSSYNKFNNNCYRQAMIVPLMNCGTSVFAGLVIFSIIGFMAHETGVEIDEAIKQGPGLVFVAYPAALAKLPISPLWAVLFFLMLLSVGLDTQFGMFETMISAFIDEYPKYLRNRKMLLTAFVCFVEFLLGIPCIMEGGIYVLQIIDWYCAVFSLMLLSFTECVVIAWVYGADRFLSDIELMIGYKPSVWWKICWKFITPIVIIGVWLFSVIQLKPVSYGDYQYPDWAIAAGWMLGLASILPLPAYALFGILTTDGTLIQRISKLTKPSPLWGPAVERYRIKYEASRSSLGTSGEIYFPPTIMCGDDNCNPDSEQCALSNTKHIS
ncbi:sodium- and chloride-dependent glycine transporter 1-like [Mytilus edulis]|uniref:sodium- and chloride-dependent glycine transporter 1-like n=1 Tax=Mytilus edulis TaxID=6550 RepID=UPI0039F015B5